MFHSENSSAVVNKRSSDFDVELCHAFFSVVSRSGLICKPCKQGLIQRYLHSKARNDLVFKVYRRINELDRPLLVRLMHELGGPEDFQVVFMKSPQGMKGQAGASEAIRYNLMLPNLFKFAYYTLSEDGESR